MAIGKRFDPMKVLWQRLDSYRWPLIAALVLHGLLLAALSVSWLSKTAASTASSAPMPMDAQLVNLAALKSSQPEMPEVKPTPPTEKSPILEKKLPVSQKATEAKEQVAQEKQRVLEKKRQDQEVLAQQKALALEKQQKTEKQKKEAAARLLEAQKKAQIQRDQEEKARRLAQESAKQKKLDQAKQASVLAKQQADLEAALMKQQMRSEQQALEHAQAIYAQGELDRYKAKIVQTISQYWLVPQDLSAGLSCQLLIRLGPGGVVLNVEVLKGSGNSVLDRSAVTAVYKASPLPVPKDSALFDKFRELRLTVRPESVLGAADNGSTAPQ